jgi:hypothetical protein
MTILLIFFNLSFIQFIFFNCGNVLSICLVLDNASVGFLLLVLMIAPLTMLIAGYETKQWNLLTMPATATPDVW